jgi:hypothetical protein
LLVSWLVSGFVSRLLLADDEAGLPEVLQPVPAKQSARESPAARKIVRTLDEALEVVDIGGTSLATRLRVLITLTSLIQTRPLQI